METAKAVQPATLSRRRSRDRPAQSATSRVPNKQWCADSVTTCAGIRSRAVRHRQLPTDSRQRVTESRPSLGHVYPRMKSWPSTSPIQSKAADRKDAALADIDRDQRARGREEELFASQ